MAAILRAVLQSLRSLTGAAYERLSEARPMFSTSTVEAVKPASRSEGSRAAVKRRLDEEWQRELEAAQRRQASRHPTPKQAKFPIGVYVYVRRSGGDESLGHVVSFDQQTGAYVVEILELASRTDPQADGSPALRKCVYEPALRAAETGQHGALRASAKFGVGQQVLVRRTDGSQSAGAVAEYDSAKRLYKVALDESDGADERVFKRAYEHMLVAADAADSSLDRCVVCYDGEKTHAIIPCGHQCVCGPCGQKLRNDACPMCRKPALMAVAIYLS